MSRPVFCPNCECDCGDLSSFPDTVICGNCGKGFDVALCALCHDEVVFEVGGLCDDCSQIEHWERCDNESWIPEETQSQEKTPWEKGVEMVLALTAHIKTMRDDAYLVGHPEWEVICEEAQDVGEYFSTYLISEDSKK